MSTHLAWLGLLAICAGVIAAKQTRLQRYAAAKMAYANKLRAIHFADDEAARLIRSIAGEDLGSGLGDPGESAVWRPDRPPVLYSKVELEQLVNDGRVLQITRRGSNFVQMTEGVRMPRRPHEYATWTYPGSSVPYEFGFLIDGAGQYRWISFRRLPSTPAPPPPGVPLLVRRLDSGGRIFWGQVGPALWLACCVAAVALAMVAPNTARAVASTGLAVAIVMCAAKIRGRRVIFLALPLAQRFNLLGLICDSRLARTLSALPGSAAQLA